MSKDIKNLEVTVDNRSFKLIKIKNCSHKCMKCHLAKICDGGRFKYVCELFDKDSHVGIFVELKNKPVRIMRNPRPRINRRSLPLPRDGEEWTPSSYHHEHCKVASSKED